jgi:hypothetical protein
VLVVTCGGNAVRAYALDASLRTGPTGAAMSKRKRYEPAIAVQPFIDDVRDSLDALEARYRRRQDLLASLIDLKINFEGLEDAIEQNISAQEQP